jgi:integrase
VTGTVTDARPGTVRRTLQAPAGDAPPRRGAADGLPAGEVLSLLLGLPMVQAWPARYRKSRLWGVPVILAWLEGHPGGGWQERWLAAGADHRAGWLGEIVAGDPRAPATRQAAMSTALTALLLARVVLPGYELLGTRKSGGLLRLAREMHRPDLFARLEQAGAEAGMQVPQARDAITVITRIVLHTGRDVDQLTGDDLLGHRAWARAGSAATWTYRGVNAAWDMMARTGLIAERRTMREAVRLGQPSAAELVDRYRLRSRPVRDLLVRYLSERAPALDYSSLRQTASCLAGAFWADIERHNPEIGGLRLPPEAARAWKERLRTVTEAGGTTRERGNYKIILGQVRAFYLDIQEWAAEDPSWAQWAVPSPVRRSELAGMEKDRRKAVSRMHQRVRERLPHLQQLADSAAAHHAAQARFLAAVTSVPAGQELTHDGTAYLRTVPKSYLREPWRSRDIPLAQDIQTGKLTNAGQAEDDAFWTWAVIETLRHTGIRVEELLEVTQLAITSYRLPKTGETLPLLQVVPSKSGEERLLLVSPELAGVLAAIVKRLRDAGNGAIPLVARYDPHEKITGPPLPHLFQRKRGWQPAVISTSLVKRMLTDALARSGITDAAGQPLRYTAHDFRRLFTTQAVTGGLPVHIAARILGHRSITTTQSYLAVFQDDLIRAYRAFLDNRRAARPEAEYRDPTDQEWREFEEHFEKRKLSLGTCGRPYGTHCAHEHACIRCPMLRPDPAARGRLTEIIANLADRIAEARVNGWAGEAEGLQASLTAARAKLATLNKTARNTAGTADLGMPAYRPAGAAT